MYGISQIDVLIGEIVILTGVRMIRSIIFWYLCSVHSDDHTIRKDSIQ